MLPKPQFPADLVTFTEEILNGKTLFFVECTVDNHKIFGNHGLPTAMKEALGKLSFCPSFNFKSKREVDFEWSLCRKRFGSTAALN